MTTSFCAATDAAKLVTVNDSIPRAAIIVAPSIKPSDFSAKALATHIKQMSGAELLIVHERDWTGAKNERGRAVAPLTKSPTDVPVIDAFIVIR